MIRLEALYRGTPSKEVSQFVPKEKIGSDLVVSATPDRAVAIKFVVPVESLNVAMGSFGDVHYYVCDNEQAFREMDKGGAIYTLPPDDFEFNPDIGIWTSPKPVAPTSKEDVLFGLDAMIGAGVQVFFVGQETFKRIKESSDRRLEILRNLVSENAKQNKNVRYFNN